MSDVRRRVGALERELGPADGPRRCTCGAGGEPLTGILLMGDEPAPAEPRICRTCGGEMLTIRIVEDVVTDAEGSKGEL